VETQIYICELESIKRIRSNYKTIGELINELLQSEIILSDTLIAGFGSHFSLINDLNSYYDECMRLLNRADLMLDIRLYNRDMKQINVYLSNKSTIEEPSRFKKNVLIQDGCRLGANCELENCWLGENCRLGSNVKLTNSIVWPNSRIGSNSTINACLIGFGVYVSSNVRICENCLFGDGVKVR
jgi:NDP-sugar pyrophosphorylase family protein